uniref:Uncharacterized protein n=1 Tax=viral metagenome TaxID=1070528 RepID=A0A6M3JG16_9ZZZZ
MKTVTLFESFNIDWLIRQVNGGNFEVFEGRNRKDTLEILTDLRKQGYTTIRNHKGDVQAE